ncbi:MAG: carboxypeptidase-like regulatory domain-containing protein [Saprospiraceae bacterium]
MRQVYLKSVATLALWLTTLCACLLAQSGIVSGKVVDGTDNLPLPGANVFLKNNVSIGTVTDIDGSFLISGVPAGERAAIF